MNTSHTKRNIVIKRSRTFGLVTLALTLALGALGLEHPKGGRRRKRALLGAFALSGMALVANPALANDWGYVWAESPGAASYTPNLWYQFNSQYGRINTISRTGVGAYTVNFPDLDAAGGTVLVTAYCP